MRLRRAVVLGALALLAPVLARAEFTSLELTPANGLLHPAPAHPKGNLQIRFAADTTGTARLSGTGLPTPVAVDYPTAGATATITLPANAISAINEWLPLELRIVTAAEGDEASEAVTTVRVAVDATRPPPPTDVRTYPANQGLVVVWTGGIPDPPPFTTNVEKYVIYWSTRDLAAALPVSVESGRGTVPEPLPAGVTAVTVSFTDNHLLEGLVNGQPTWVAVEAIDHVGWRSGVAVDGDGRVTLWFGADTTARVEARAGESAPWVDLGPRRGPALPGGIWPPGAAPSWRLRAFARTATGPTLSSPVVIDVPVDSGRP